MDKDAVTTLVATISAIDTARSTDAALDAFSGALSKFGINSFLIAGLPVPHDAHWHREILYDHWPREWYARYFDEGHFAHDPCVRWSRHTAGAFLWQDLPPEHLSDRAKRVMEEAAEFGMRDGICVPVHLPLAGPAVVTVASDRIELPPLALPLIETLCVHVFRTLSGRIDPLDDAAPLTPREREVLQWSAHGKSAEDIATILGLTKNTVESHHRNIRDKLDAASLVHAVAKALRRREIQI